MMRKIISLFKRNYDSDYLVRDEVVEGAEWVLAGEGVATRKMDGTCCRIKNGKLYKRFELKKDKQAPEGFEPAQGPDPVTGDQPGWVPVGEGKEDKWFREGLQNLLTSLDVVDTGELNGTYELVGPKINGNPEGFPHHNLISHSKETELLLDCPRIFNEIKEYLSGKDIEGIVWHHPDGRMVKIKKRDFGLKRK